MRDVSPAFRSERILIPAPAAESNNDDVVRRLRVLALAFRQAPPRQDVIGDECGHQAEQVAPPRSVGAWTGSMLPAFLDSKHPGVQPGAAIRQPTDSPLR